MHLSLKTRALIFLLGLSVSLSPGCGKVSVLGTTTSSTTSTSGGGSGGTAPSSLSYTVHYAVYMTGVAITTNTPTVTGSVASYAVSPALPGGLDLDTTTGLITGTPVGTAAVATYTITATNPTGNTTRDVTIGVEAGFIVNSLLDTSDAAAGNGSCDVGGGVCTLRAAIEESNAWGVAGQSRTIILPAGTIVVDATTISIGAANLSNLYITGQGSGSSIISGGLTAPRVFALTGATNTTFAEVSLSNGRDNAAAGEGGFVRNNNTGTTTFRNCIVSNNAVTSAVGSAGAIGVVNAGATTVIENCTLTNNHAPEYAGVIGGTGTFTITDSTFSSNSTTNVGSGLGGSIWKSGTMNITNTTFTSNSSHEGGAIYIYNGTTTITGSTFTSNTTTDIGGAIALDSTGGGVTLNIVTSSFNSNTSTVLGGALYLRDGTTTISSSTFSGNTAESGGAIHVNTTGAMTATNITVSGNDAQQFGGGISVVDAGSAIILRQSTIANNRARVAGVGGFGGGLEVRNGTSATLIQTIIANNSTQGTPDNCNTDTITDITAGSYNLFDTAGANCNNSGTDISSADTSGLASSLASNGGSVQTLLTTSTFDGVDAIPSGSCFSLLDARTTVRPRDGDGNATADCDIGALEL